MEKKRTAGLFGSLLLSSILGVIYTMKSLKIYFLSYIYHYSSNIVPNHLDQTSYLIVLCFTLSGIAISQFIDRVNIRLVSFIGSAFIMSTFYFVEYIKKLTIFMLLDGCIIGLGSGLIYISLLKSIWCYFPKQKGLFTGLTHFTLTISGGLVT